MEQLRQHRQSRGLSLKSVADFITEALVLDIPVAPSTISRIERGQARMPDEFLSPWLDALSLSGDERVAAARAVVPVALLVEIEQAPTEAA